MKKIRFALMLSRLAILFIIFCPSLSLAQDAVESLLEKVREQELQRTNAPEEWSREKTGLVASASGPCSLFINGKLELGYPLKARAFFALAPGSYALKCSSVTLGAAQGDVVVEPNMIESWHAQLPRFQVIEGGLIVDTVGKKVWTSREINGEVSHTAATKLCSARGAGWRLPTAVEFATIGGVADFTIGEYSSQFWLNGRSGKNATLRNFYNGTTRLQSADMGLGRVLCVRSVP